MFPLVCVMALCLFIIEILTSPSIFYICQQHLIEMLSLNMSRDPLEGKSTWLSSGEAKGRACRARHDHKFPKVRFSNIAKNSFYSA